MALEAENADERRKGVIGLAESRDANADWAVQVYDTIARTDVNTAVRCAALRAMTPGAGESQIATALKIMESREKKHEDVRPAAGQVRAEAAKLILTALERGTAPTQPEIVLNPLMSAAAKDPDRNVRLTALDALGYCRDAAVFPVLVDVLEEEDFALRHAAELSLVALTGHTHDHSAPAWRDWLSSTANPFELAGRTPPELQASQESSRMQWPW